MRGFGSVAEWSIAPVLKTGNGQPFVSSNLTASASTCLSRLELTVYPAKIVVQEPGEDAQFRSLHKDWR